MKMNSDFYFTATKEMSAKPPFQHTVPPSRFVDLPTPLLYIISLKLADVTHVTWTRVSLSSRVNITYVLYRAYLLKLLTVKFISFFLQFSSFCFKCCQQKIILTAYRVKLLFQLAPECSWELAISKNLQYGNKFRILCLVMESGDRYICDPKTLCIQTYHVIC